MEEEISNIIYYIVHGIISLFYLLLATIMVPLAVYYMPIIFSYLEGDIEGVRRYKEWWKRLGRFLRDGK